ncbi:hypothetical protein SDRG_14200 [Saprolegnia diclina VS20]|uniref:Uncharacterized protein n=1 Tax=Saprolegnia diclina (strain VS20) TaxID=1156394 RepID=T0R7P2_SAPDV|nr:hypothetical protein SDRG_14200 [Saprolegnia diclina VS20]EQC28108.1 hypothetical protein SDRG_14200 [Saprolegnia diclina VS20]|eukprot:XP_008618533.1 hypothetical protein SDRG_14200 [Saprolegnia diclina VS20]
MDFDMDQHVADNTNDTLASVCVAARCITEDTILCDRDTEICPSCLYALPNSDIIVCANTTTDGVCERGTRCSPVPTPTTRLLTTAPAPVPQADDIVLSTEAVIGLIAAIVVLVLAVGCLLVYRRRHKTASPTTDAHREPSVHMSPCPCSAYHASPAYDPPRAATATQFESSNTSSIASSGSHRPGGGPYYANASPARCNDDMIHLQSRAVVYPAPYGPQRYFDGSGALSDAQSAFDDVVMLRAQPCQRR